MKKSSFKYAGVAAAALLAVAPIAAPVITAAPAIVQAAVTPGDEAISSENMGKISDALNGSMTKETNISYLDDKGQLTQAAKDLQTWTSKIVAYSDTAKLHNYDDFYGNSNPFMDLATITKPEDIFNGLGKEGKHYNALLSYTISGGVNGLDGNQSTAALNSDFAEAARSEKGGNYILTILAYDESNGSTARKNFLGETFDGIPVKPVSLKFHINGTGKDAVSEIKAKATFANRTVKTGEAAPGLLANFPSIQSDVTEMVSYNGVAQEILNTKDIAAVTYKDADGAKVESNGLASIPYAYTQDWTDFSNQNRTKDPKDPKFLNTTGDKFNATGAFFQIVKLTERQVWVQNTLTSLETATDAQGNAINDVYLNNSSLFYHKDATAKTGALYLVRKINVQGDQNYTPWMNYSYYANSKDTRFADSETMILSPGDQRLVSSPDGSDALFGLDYQPAVTDVVKNLFVEDVKDLSQSAINNKFAASLLSHTDYEAFANGFADGGLVNDQNGQVKLTVPTAADVKAAAVKAGLEIVKNDKNVETIKGTGTFNVPVKATYKAQTATFYVPVRVRTKGVEAVENKPVFVFTNNTDKDATLEIGAAFNPYKGVIAYTDPSKTAQILPENWTVKGSVDTDKAGVYHLTYSATNPVTKEVATMERVITVGDGVEEGDTNVTPEEGVVYVKYVPGYSIAVWNTYDASKKVTGNYLKHASAWKYFATAKGANGNTWYNLGGDQWIDGGYTSKTPVTNIVAEKFDATGVVNYKPGWGIAVWTKAFGTEVTGKTLNHGTSWKIFERATNQANGRVFYNLGGNQWVDGRFLNLK